MIETYFDTNLFQIAGRCFQGRKGFSSARNNRILSREPLDRLKQIIAQSW
jgi:hypothetical protein